MTDKLSESIRFEATYELDEPDTMLMHWADEVAALEAELFLLKDTDAKTSEIYRLRTALDAHRKVKASLLASKRTLEQRVEGLEEALHKAAEQYGEIGAPEVHRVWRDTMLKQERRVSDEKIDWRGLPLQDIYLDERIARAIAKDFLVWAFSHVEALTSQEEA